MFQFVLSLQINTSMTTNTLPAKVLIHNHDIMLGDVFDKNIELVVNYIVGDGSVSYVSHSDTYYLTKVGETVHVLPKINMYKIKARL